MSRIQKFFSPVAYENILSVPQEIAVDVMCIRMPVSTEATVHTVWIQTWINGKQLCQICTFLGKPGNSDKVRGIVYKACMT